MKPYLILLLSFYHLTTNAQTRDIKKSHYTLNVTCTPQLFLNSCNVENDGKIPEAISTINTGGYTLGAEIERKNMHGLLLSFGLQYGRQHHNITMGYENLSFFDPSIATKLNTLGSFIEVHSATTSYINMSIVAGYVIPYKVLNGCNIEFKAGLSARFYLRGYNKPSYIGIQVLKNDTIFLSDVSNQNINLGDNFNGEPSWQKGMEFYLGLCKNMHYRFLKNISIGFELTRAISSGASGWAEVQSYSLYSGSKPISTDYYQSKDFSIGLKFSAGLWCK
jgi:hypothetical protein